MEVISELRAKQNLALMGVTSSKSSASRSTDTSKGEAERFYSCYGPLKQTAKSYCTIEISTYCILFCTEAKYVWLLRTGIVDCHSRLQIDTVRIKKINEDALFNNKHKDLRSRDDLISSVTHPS